MYGVIFWIVWLVILAPCILCCASKRLKFWTFFCRTPDTAPAGLDLEKQGATGPQNKKAIFVAAIFVALLLSYFSAAIVTAVYISAAIDYFPGDTYESCGVANPSTTDKKTKCDWTHYSFVPPSPMQEVTFKSGDGKTDLVGWWLNASTPTRSAVGSMLYHHGSGLNIAAAYREVRYDIYLKQGISCHFLYLIKSQHILGLLLKGFAAHVMR